jgi:hypothetical protein
MSTEKNLSEDVELKLPESIDRARKTARIYVDWTFSLSSNDEAALLIFKDIDHLEDQLI